MNLVAEVWQQGRTALLYTTLELCEMSDAAISKLDAQHCLR